MPARPSLLFGSANVAPLPGPGLKEPLLGPEKKFDGTADDQRSIDDDGLDARADYVSDNVITLVKESTFLLFAITSLAASMIVVSAPGSEHGVVAQVFTLIAGSLGIINSMRVMRGTFVLLNGQDLRESINLLRQQAKELEENIPILGEAVDQLTTEADLMKRFEDDLQVIASQQGISVDEIVNLVIDNEMNIEKQKINLRLITVYFIVKVFFCICKDFDRIVRDTGELHFLINYLKDRLNPRGIDVDYDMLESLVTRHGLEGLLKLCSHLIFSRIDKYEKGDALEMFVVQDRYTRGSVRGARGHKALLASIKNPGQRNTVSRRVNRELASKLCRKGAPPYPREITIESNAIEDTEPAPEDNLIEANPVLSELPEAALSMIAEYLSKTTRAVLCVALSAPTSSWEKHHWKVKPCNNTRAILSANFYHGDDDQTLDDWEVIDFSEPDVVPDLTDALLGGILVCIDAPQRLKRLQLTSQSCSLVTGRGLGVLRSSSILEQVDLSLVDLHEDPILSYEALICEDEVVPILDQILDNGDSLRHIQLPKRWQEDRRPLLSQFLSKFDAMLRNRRLRCSKCDDLCQSNASFPVVVQRGEHYGLPYYTCYLCCQHFCSKPEHNFNFCNKCKKKFCEDCNPTYECEICNEMTCHGCTQINKCDECHRKSCAECVPVLNCEFCDRNRCMDCSDYIMCSNDGCGKINCYDCPISGDPRFVNQCEECDGEFCGTCYGLLEICEDDDYEYCIECHKARCNRTELRRELKRRSQVGDTNRPKCWRKYEKPRTSARKKKKG